MALLRKKGCYWPGLGNLILSVSGFCLLFLSTPGIAAENPQVFGEARYRYEFVDQSGVSKNANASTLRTNIGVKAEMPKGFEALLEGQVVSHMGNDNFNDTVNQKSSYPTVADPDIEELNQLWLAWQGEENTTLTPHLRIGRQKINLDNQRFIGTVNWRQNDQTFDGAQIRARNDSLAVMYTYINNVNRVFGNDHPQGDLDANIHLAQASYAFRERLQITAYSYWLELNNLANRSSHTVGVRATENIPISAEWTFAYEAEMAKQTDHKNNLNDYEENYYHIAPSISGHGFKFGAGYEILGGNGSSAFQTPLATLHKFNGWADAFLNTPNAGLEDTYIHASYTLADTNTPLDGMRLTAIYHDFESNTDGIAGLGEELDLSLGKSFDLHSDGHPLKKLNVLLKYADFNGEGSTQSREKFWLQVGVNF